MQFKVAEQFSQLMRTYPVGIPTAYSGDYGNEWTHLILTYVIQVSCLIQLLPLHGWNGSAHCVRYAAGVTRKSCMHAHEALLSAHPQRLQARPNLVVLVLPDYCMHHICVVHASPSSAAMCDPEISEELLQGKWEPIMELPGRGPPPGARALCPDGGGEYATVVYHYAR